MKSTPYLRRMWVMYKKVMAEEDFDRRELTLAQNAFYTGARGILKVMAHLVERGDYEELHRVIERHGRQIDRIMGSGPAGRTDTKRCPRAKSQVESAV